MAPVSARMLLESPELADVATDHLMSLGNRVLRPGHRPEVRALVSQGFKNITGYIRSQHPESFRVLDTLQLNADQTTALLNLLPRMNDPRMHSLGFEVGQTLHECAPLGRECVKRKLAEKFQPRVAEIRQLREDIIPPVLRNADEEWGVMVDPEQMTLMKTLPSDWKPENGMATLQSRRLVLSGKELKLEDAFGIVTAFAEQSRLLLDHIDQISRIFGHELNIPGWSRALVGATDLATGMLSCMIDAQGNTMMMSMCPMRYEDAAADLFKVFTGKTAPWRPKTTTTIIR